MDFVDVTINLVTRKFFPYWKSKNKPFYVNGKSNQPPTIINKLPNTTSKHLPDLAYNEKEFQKARPLYITFLKENSYKSEMKYEKL